MKNILIINGSISGNKGNCAKLIEQIKKHIAKSYSVDVLTLAETSNKKIIEKKLSKTSAFIFTTGTYWDSWGSPLQKFLEDFTDLEGSPVFMGKPCAVFVLNHSVGGKSVLSRLQGVLSTFGCVIPPMSGMVYSLVNDLVIKKTKSVHADDLWSLSDIAVAVANLHLATNAEIEWQSWAVDRKNFRKVWVSPI